MYMKSNICAQPPRKGDPLQLVLSYTRDHRVSFYPFCVVKLQEYLVMCEFSTPLYAIAQCERGMKTHMSARHRQDQKTTYDALLQDVIRKGTERGNVLKHCKVLFFTGM